jgi:hypothetical protein
MLRLSRKGSRGPFLLHFQDHHERATPFTCRSPVNLRSSDDSDGLLRKLQWLAWGERVTAPGGVYQQKGLLRDYNAPTQHRAAHLRANGQALGTGVDAEVPLADRWGRHSRLRQTRPEDRWAEGARGRVAPPQVSSARKRIDLLRWLWRLHGDRQLSCVVRYV